MAILQTNSGTSADVDNPSSAAWGANLTVGSIIVLYLFNDSGTANYVTSVASTGVTWTRRNSQGGNGGHEIWSGLVTSAVTTAMTFGFSQTAATRIVWLAQERDDIDATTPYDKVSTITTGTSTAPLSGTTGTLTNADSIVTGHVGWTTGTSTVSLGSGYTNLTNNGSATSSARFAAMESKTVAATTATTAAFTLGTSRPWGAFAAVWKARATGTAYTATPTDTVGITDSVALDRGRAPVDPVGITDSVALVQTNDRTVGPDAVGITDSVTTIISLSAGMPIEPIGITDSVSVLYSIGYQAGPVDPVGITDAATLVRTVQHTAGPDAVGLTDSVALVQANARTVGPDAVGISDSVTAVRGLTASPSDAVGITDSVTAIITDEYAGEWQYIYVPWGTEQFTIPDLTPGMPYDLQIRAMDASGNASPWSDSEQLYGALDTTPPSTPAAPTVVASKIALQVISTLGKASGGTYNLESDLALFEVHASSSSGFTPTTATKIGTMPADKGIMLAATPAVATFQTDALVAQYVRVIAIDKTGNRSPASATASAVPGLLDSAYISELTATKISAGTLGADVIVGARIKTANSGARVELNTAGLQAFNTGGTQTVGISAADGSAFFEGTIRTGSTGARIIMDPAAGAPVIRFYPSSGTNYAFVNAVDATTSASLGMNSSSYGTAPNDSQHRVYLSSAGATMETFKPTVQTQRGGRVQTTTGGVTAAYVYDGTAGGTLDVLDGISRIGMRNTADTAWVSYLQVGSDGNIRFLGKFPNSSAQFSTSALVTGGFGVGSGFSGASVSYGFTMASSMAPIYALNGTPLFLHCISASSTSSFDVDWGPTDGTSTYTAKTLWYWVFRF